MDTFVYNALPILNGFLWVEYLNQNYHAEGYNILWFLANLRSWFQASSISNWSRTKKHGQLLWGNTGLAAPAGQSLCPAPCVHHVIEDSWLYPVVRNITIFILRVKTEAPKVYLTSPGSQQARVVLIIQASLLHRVCDILITFQKSLVSDFVFLLPSSSKKYEEIRQGISRGSNLQRLYERNNTLELRRKERMFWPMAVTWKWGSQCTHGRHSFQRLVIFVHLCQNRFLHHCPQFLGFIQYPV